jgi:hypothetical protein
MLATGALGIIQMGTIVASDSHSDHWASDPLTT